MWAPLGPCSCWKRPVAGEGGLLQKVQRGSGLEGRWGDRSSRYIRAIPQVIWKPLPWWVCRSWLSSDWQGLQSTMGTYPTNPETQSMFSHIMIGSNDIERSQRFYDALLGVLGVGEPVRNVLSLATRGCFTATMAARSASVSPSTVKRPPAPTVARSASNAPRPNR